MKRIAHSLLLTLLVSPTLLADQIELTNGDTISGKVVSLNATHLKLQSEVLGDVTLARENVAAVYLGERKAPTKVVAAPTVAVPLDPAAAPKKGTASADDFIRGLLGQPSGDELAPNLPKGGPSGATPKELLGKLKPGDVDAKSLAEVQKMFPLLATKEAGGYFNDTLGGLLTGKLGIGDIRKDAIKARDGIMELRKELGRDADALNPYLGILEKFIKETETEEQEEK